MESDNGGDAIVLDGVTKAYRHYQRPLDRLRELLGSAGRHVDRVSVSDASFRVGRGEVVGLIGRNGAGKSTLLKMIAGRLEPTKGEVRVNGSISAILELGTGFHPDLSGRENVRVGGLCLGLTRSQIEREMDNIIAFSELEDVIDMPFRTYSTGMQARLTFATAVTVDPDILIIDEALSVGDNKFQLKSFNRIRQFKEAGKTILLVTHSMGSVTSFCDRAILLDHGSVLADGDPNWVTSVYHHLQFGDLDPASLVPPTEKDGAAAVSDETGVADTVQTDPAAPEKAADAPVSDSDIKSVGTGPESGVNVDGEPSLQVAQAVTKRQEPESETTSTAGTRPGLATPFNLWTLPRMRGDEAEYEAGLKKGYRYGDRRATIDGVAIIKENGTVTRMLQSGQRYALVMDCISHVDADELYCGFLIKDLRGDTLFGADTSTAASPGTANLHGIRAGELRRVVMAMTMWLSAGDYVVSGALTTEVGRQSDMWFDAFEFSVAGTPELHSASRVNLSPSFFVQTLEEEEEEMGVGG
ncbi:MAG: ABC transporter ATP-binding protein [Roseitalea sp.]|nr:ABC transporter ATP-binding protein [Roseitalea sp.]MBO6950907.1 ABC transporter ATP-binding protein [Rhizobiaceae bacterium]MBO6591106.1 ABC transporter ATP-binding protein [Roseitalea sp.]MBO6599636.1 ABC transporter ATP-binding protein [Roseitalea sp.]MBO6613887.1 ABC transporter ATP-binding protein [Roseitalea sp.]